MQNEDLFAKNHGVLHDYCQKHGLEGEEIYRATLLRDGRVLAANFLQSRGRSADRDLRSNEKLGCVSH